MLRQSLLRRTREHDFLFRSNFGLVHIQTRSLYRAKIKWHRDKVLDEIVIRMEYLKSVSTLMSLISSSPEKSLAIRQIRRHRNKIGLPKDIRFDTFIKNFPTIFRKSYAINPHRSYIEEKIPRYELTWMALELRKEEDRIFKDNEIDILNRLKKLIMIAKDGVIPIQVVKNLRWELGLPLGFRSSVLSRHGDSFSMVRPGKKVVALKLKAWDEELAVSHLRKTSSSESDCLAFPMKFLGHFRPKRKILNWIKEWQTLPYTCPYSDSSHLDLRTDDAEKRLVGVFHEIFHLSLEKSLDLMNLRDLRYPFGLPVHYRRVFKRHPGIFYVSRKCDKRMVILKEAFDGDKLLYDHPIVEFRRKFAGLIQQDQFRMSQERRRIKREIKSLN